MFNDFHTTVRDCLRVGVTFGFRNGLTNLCHCFVGLTSVEPLKSECAPMLASVDHCYATRIPQPLHDTGLFVVAVVQWVCANAVAKNATQHVFRNSWEHRSQELESRHPQATLPAIVAASAIEFLARCGLMLSPASIIRQRAAIAITFSGSIRVSIDVGVVERTWISHI